MASLLESLVNVFGYEIAPKEKKAREDKSKTFAPPESDGSYLLADGRFSHAIAFENVANSEFTLIEFYRQMALHPQVDMAIEEIVNEAIVNDEKNVPVEINLDLVEVPKSVQTKIKEEFEYLLGLLDFNTKGYRLFRDWYIDSRLVYHKAIDMDKPKEGILELHRLDPRKIIKIKELETERTIDNRSGQQAAEFPVVAEEYYMYFQTPIEYDSQSKFGFSNTASMSRGNIASYANTAMKINLDAIAFVHSGLVDQSSNIIYGYLQKAIKSYNVLNMMEDSLVIYRITRATEKRVFYIDVGNLPPQAAEEYLRKVQSRYKNKVTYDAVTGVIKDSKRVVAMQEDFWLPRREGGRATEISSLAGGDNLGAIDDVLMFKTNLWNALTVPSSRFKEDTASIVLGKQAEVSREELKFSKFITRLRTQFSELFNDLLRTQLLLKGIIDEEEWEEIKENIQYNFLQDSYFTEAKEAELLKARVETALAIEPLVEKGYYSHTYVRKNVLKQTDDEIEQIQKEREKEEASQMYGPSEDEIAAEEEEAAAAETPTTGGENTPTLKFDNPVSKEEEE